MTLETAAAIDGFEQVDVADRQIDGPSPGQSLRLRLYSRGDSRDLRPCLLWIHGGGYILGCPEMDEQLLCRKADELGCLVVAVDYRL
ncbi:MAG: alpha/beta hydrolase fold domain-containing protein, partial [Chromatiales bacterium]|nr:alpha/beta hydrolase fold domain-containing protein [Chromatiales bacterium]